MVEAIGNLVVINGRFIAIDHTNKAQDGIGHTTIVNVYDNDEVIRDKEINAIVESFCSAGVGCLAAGKTIFSFTNIWQCNPNNDPMLKNHEESTKMVVVKNRKTKEFFLVMSETASLNAAGKFLDEVNRKELSLFLEFPHETKIGELKVRGNPKFEIVTNSGIAVIKLWAKT